MIHSFSSPRGDFIILTKYYIDVTNNELVFVPSRGFHYINLNKNFNETILKQFSSPRGDFIILTIICLNITCTQRTVFVPSRGFHYINYPKFNMDKNYALFSSPRGDFIILTYNIENNQIYEISFRPLAGISLY